MKKTYDNNANQLRFENIGFNALFVTDLKDFYDEYVKLLILYKDLSEEVQDALNEN